jgi:hypothetical protein
MPGPADKIVSSHCVVLVGYDDDKRTFKVQNSWGTKWGDEGYGYVPYDFVDRYVVECWVALLHIDEPATIEDECIVINWGIPSCLNSIVNGVEIRDGITEEYKPGAFEFQFEGFLPAYRGEGLAKTLIGDLVKLSTTLVKPLRFWVPFADSSKTNMQIVRHIANTYGYKLSPAPVRWASHIIT